MAKELSYSPLSTTLGTGSHASSLNVLSLLSRFTQNQRMFALTTPLGDDALLVETITGSEAVDKGFSFDITCLGDNAFIPLSSLIGQDATLKIQLPTVSAGYRVIHGIVSRFSYIGSDGGFARYALTLVPWTHLLSLRRNNQVLMDVNLEGLLNAVFKPYPMANWRLDLTANYPQRSYVVQYRESDLDFVSRWLRRLGLFYYFHYDEGASDQQSKHQLVITDNMDSLQPCVQDAVRFHRSSATEESDTLTAFNLSRSSGLGSVALQSWDYQKAASTSAQVPTAAHNGEHPNMEHYDAFGQYAYADSAEADHAALVAMQVVEARNHIYHASGTVRSFEVGQTFELTQHPSFNGRYAVLAIDHTGVNNLPADIAEAAQIGSLSKETGTYTSTIRAMPNHVPYRPFFDALQWPQVQGLQSAIVAGSEGTTDGKGEVTHTDSLGRIKVQFQWDTKHADSAPSTWLRVAQAFAGANFGAQFIPRIGQEVLIDFTEGDIDRPLAIASVYNGANQPAWHDPGTLAGFKSNEFNGGGYAQWVLDDTTGQLRTSFQVTQAQAQLNLGYLVHQTDNERGERRGEGFELRTDAVGTVRAQSGLYLSTHGQNKAKGHFQAADEAKATLSSGAELAQALGDAAQGLKSAGQPLAATSKTALTDTFKPATDKPFQLGKASLVLASGADTSVSSPQDIMHYAQSQQLSAGQNWHTNAGNQWMGLAGKDIHLTTLDGGLKWHAGQGKVSLEAQHNTMTVEAEGDITITSTNGNVTIAATTVKLAAGGSGIEVNGGSVNVKTGGLISVKGAGVSFGGAGSASIAAVHWPESDNPIGAFSRQFCLTDAKGKAMSNISYFIKIAGKDKPLAGVTDKKGRTPRVYAQSQKDVKVYWGDAALREEIKNKSTAV